jgi:hypothetical protein
MAGTEQRPARTFRSCVPPEPCPLELHEECSGSPP